jgi:polyphosphate kinase
MTHAEEMGADASDLFNYLTGYSKQEDYNKFIVAPLSRPARKSKARASPASTCKKILRASSTSRLPI